MTSKENHKKYKTMSSHRCIHSAHRRNKENEIIRRLHRNTRQMVHPLVMITKNKSEHVSLSPHER